MYRTAYWTAMAVVGREFLMMVIITDLEVGKNRGQFTHNGQATRHSVYYARECAPMVERSTLLSR